MNQRRPTHPRVRRSPRHVPPSRYLAIGARALVVSPVIIGWRLMRHLASLGTGAVPAMAIGAALWLASNPDAAADPLRSTEPSTGGVVLTLVVALLALGLRAAATAFEFGAARAAIGAGSGSPRDTLRATWTGFAALSALHAILSLGVGAVALPVVASAVRGAVHAPGSWTAALALAAALFATLAAVLLVRYATMLFEAHLAWEPRFVSRAAAGALGGPVLRTPLHARLLGLWAFGAGLVTLVGATFGTIAIACWFERIPIPPAAIGGVLVTATVGAVVGAWFDATLVAMVGHARGNTLVVRVPAPEPPSRPTSGIGAGLVVGAWTRVPGSALAFPPADNDTSAGPG